ncbi:MAG: hypothetical protein K5752_00190 [Succinivibrionaceae bacterium]|nr:hypothetical protein [Succinivibrionaceae bacterium]
MVFSSFENGVPGQCIMPAAVFLSSASGHHIMALTSGAVSAMKRDQEKNENIL